ncbi:MAG: helix-turn-helix transcriptional regulator [Acidobacteriaceae bacterium]|nr:helix-turn-helix transcriptional regulator [Acidobacteriaceae bacterium]MBV9444046.1 helix-turn-helix transcriptional regulator [Acidobacteriaceae bacterium]
MTIAEKLRYLRVVEGHLRGLNREMTQKEVATALRDEMKTPLSQPYLSQLEGGRRKHLTNTTRLILAKFFRVHPGYLVDDPEGFQTELSSDLGLQEDNLDLWLVNGAEQFRQDGRLAEALLKIAGDDDTRGCLLLLAAILQTPALADRLWEVLKSREDLRHELA